MKTSEILDKAADVIERNGWSDDGWYTEPEAVWRPPEECPVCVLAAINLASGVAIDKEPLGRRALAARTLARHLGLGQRFNIDEDNVSNRGLVELLGERWNDQFAASADQVVTALRECAAAEREAGR